ncbi:hypothetical protein [Steroidobacter sp.]|uniref:hypothetical protein n=1 Tax=Steroidobacter sp. TaxID=1978227 RepID=UPI001A5CA8A5|nr:hypothetical protein [Steroidobacter sp.]MBL8264985.1 hypothetical protein [Steroidobacter sp.]
MPSDRVRARCTPASATAFGGNEAAGLHDPVDAGGPHCASRSVVPAAPKTYTSSNGSYRLTVFPRELAGALPYFEDKVADNAEAGQRSEGLARCEAVLERLEGAEYRRVWRKQLVNDVSPVSALVSAKDGSFVTFDNWHSRGWGDDAIVIYDGAGQVKRKLALTSIMSKQEFDRLPRSASSIWWSGEHEIDYDEVIVNVRVVTTNDSKSSDGSQYRTIRLSLETAQVLQ